MSFSQSMRLAVKSLLASKMRALLTMLGIIIGVAAVIVIVGLGNGMELYMTNQFEQMGTNLLTVNIFGRGSSRTVSEEDMYRMAEEHPELISLISPTVGVQQTIKIGTETVNSSTIYGVGEDYDDLNSMEMSQGRFLQYVDVLRQKSVCAVGSYINEEYFGGEAVGEKLKIGGRPFTIVGVVDEIADSSRGSNDDYIFIPYSNASRMSFSSSAGSYIISCTDEDRVSEAKGLVEDTLFEVFEDDDAYMVIAMSELLDVMNEMLSVMITILTAIAAISLLVGGIGIMNIMLVSVSERTREIGIRKSLGAKQRDIMRQFVIEAATTSAIGGLLGIAVGYWMSSVASWMIETFMEETMEVVPKGDAVLAAFGISVAIGIIFGYLPAKKAAKLNPIDALRYD